MDKGEIPFSIFIDLSKAFDTLDHEILLFKLRYYGLENIAQYIKLEDVVSKVSPISTGVPQGSILGPLLFIVYMNDIATCTSLFQTIMYADDTTLVGNLSTFDNDDDTGKTINERINNELELLSDWLKLNRLSLNEGKPKFMLVHSPTKEIPRITIRLNNIELEPTSDFNFLGIIINKHLKWNAHIDKISNNIARTNGFEPLFKRLNLLKICDIHKIQQLKMFYKLVRKDLPEYFNTIPVTKLSDIHDHVTRNRNTYYTNRVAHKFADKCFRQSIFHTVNHVPELIREKIFTHSLKGFSNYSKTLFVSNYLYECMIPHCYVCNC